MGSPDADIDVKAGPGGGKLDGDADADAWVVILFADYLCRGAAGIEHDAVVQVLGGDFGDRGQDLGGFVVEILGLQVDVAGGAAFPERCEQDTALEHELAGEPGPGQTG
jgi:hypothetical protein